MTNPESSLSTENVDDYSDNVSFRVARDEFAQAMMWVTRNIQAKTAQPVLRGVLITAHDDGLVLCGYDYDISNSIRVHAEVEAPGAFVVTGRLLSSIVQIMPNKPIVVKANGTVVHCVCGSSKVELPLMPREDYPQLPSLPAETGTVDTNLFSEAVTQVAIAAGKDDTLPMLTGIHLEMNDTQVCLVATDRFRLAVRTFEWQPSKPDISAEMLIPAKALLDNAKNISGGVSDTLTIAAGGKDKIGAEGLFGMEVPGRETTMRLLDAEFPHFRPLLPKTHTAFATITIKALSEAIKRVSLVADHDAQIRMALSEGQVILSAGARDAGHAEEILTCDFVGEPLTIAFNSTYLHNGLSVIPTERAVFGFTQSSHPAVIIPEPEGGLPIERTPEGEFPSPDTSFVYLIMPVRLPG